MSQFFHYWRLRSCQDMLMKASSSVFFCTVCVFLGPWRQKTTISEPFSLSTQRSPFFREAAWPGLKEGFVGFQNSNAGNKKVWPSVAAMVAIFLRFQNFYGWNWWMQSSTFSFCNDPFARKTAKARPGNRGEATSYSNKTGAGLKKPTYCTSSAGSMEEQWGRSPSGYLWCVLDLIGVTDPSNHEVL